MTHLVSTKTQYKNVDSFTCISLCAGTAGIDLGIRLALPTARTVCYVENEVTNCLVLAARMRENAIDDAPIWTDVRTFDGREWRGHVHCIVAGYPCQPFSIAGRRKGSKDKRHLWPQVARIIAEVRPRAVFLENVAHHLRLGFPTVRRELREMGFEVAAGEFSAAEVGASHLRKRLFALGISLADGSGRGRGELRQSRKDDGFADWCRKTLADFATRQFSDSWRRSEERAGVGPSGKELADAGQGSAARGRRRSREATSSRTSGESDRHRGILAVTDDKRLAVRSGVEEDSSKELAPAPGGGLALYPLAPGPDDFETWADIIALDASLEPAICRASDGTANRVDRLRALGNGVVPLVAAVAFRTLLLAHYERHRP